MNKKCAKVICCYFGNRRTIHNTPKNILDFIKKNIQNEIEMENGIDTDVFFVINNTSNERDNQLDEYDGIKTKNGKIIIINRPNYKGSFGAYYDIFYQYHSEYDYWFFCEDDVLIYKQKYMFDFVNYLESDSTIGFVSLAPITVSEPFHSGGGCGLTSTEKFLKVNPLDIIQTYLNGNESNSSSYENLIPLEIEFTNSYVKNGFRLVNYPKYSPLCDNYHTHFGQKNHAREEMKKLEFIYKVG